MIRFNLPIPPLSLFFPNETATLTSLKCSVICVRVNGIPVFKLLYQYGIEDQAQAVGANSSGICFWVNYLNSQSLGISNIDILAPVL